jgi:nucleoside-diphosphate-sugar epimerase
MPEALRILVTGGAGYIGAVLVPALLARGHRVTVLDDFRYSQDSLAACCACDGFSVVRGDARDERTVREALRSVDLVIPLAALVGAPLCAQDPIGATTTNLDAVKRVCSLRSPDQWVIYPNTNSGYGVGEGGQPCTEDTAQRPISLYGRTKVEAEAAVMDGPNALAFRLATVFGMSPRMRIDLLVNDFVHRAVRDSALVVFQGHFKRNYIHVRDVARAFIHAIDNFGRMKGQVYNVGLDSANLSKLELCERIKRHLPRFTYLEAPIGEDPDQRDYVVLNDKIRATGFEPCHSLDDGIRELIKGFAMVRDREYRNA